MQYRVADTSGDSDYDNYLRDTLNRPVDEAQGILSKAIARVKRENPDEYTWGDVVDVLWPLGFEPVCFIRAHAEF